jgi:RNA polymerase sigma factor (sigma-70 family)
VSGDALALRLAPDVRAAAGGDTRAFARLVDATRGPVAAIALAIVRDVELSREVAQDVYLAAWRDLAKLREPASFLPWLRQMARNRAKHAVRGEARRRRRVSDGHADALLAAAADPAPDAVERLVEAEEREALAAAIDALPPSAREVVVLYYREGRSARQVGELLGLGEDAVKQRLSRARSRLRESMERHLRDTAPTAAFTAAVMFAVSAAAPSTAAAATIAAGKAALGTKGAKAGLFGLTGGALAGGLAGLAGGWWGVISGARRMLAAARDDRERRGILQMSAVCMAVTLAFMVAILADPRPITATVAFLAMMGTFGVVHFVWLPRIVRRRLEAELREDPVGAALEHARRRKQAILGFTLGTVLGGAPVVASWFF